MEKTENKKSKRVMISLNDQLLEILGKIREKYGLSKSSIVTTLVAKYAEAEYGIKEQKE